MVTVKLARVIFNPYLCLKQKKNRFEIKRRCKLQERHKLTGSGGNIKRVMICDVTNIIVYKS